MLTATPKTKQVLDIVTAGLEVGDGRRLNNAPGVFMALSVERLSEDIYATSHYFEQNGDLVPDPDVTWWRSPSGDWVPLSIQHSTGNYSEPVELENGVPVRFAQRALSDLVSFCATWIAVNVVDQQGGLDALRRACAAGRST